jgi:hypothetical protein
MPSDVIPRLCSGSREENASKQNILASDSIRTAKASNALQRSISMSDNGALEQSSK